MNKKVVILSAFATPFRSGAEACAEEVSALLNDRYDITIVTARLRKDLPYLDRLESGVRVWRVGVGRPVDKWLFPLLAPFAVRALRPDVVHAVLESFAGLAMVMCRFTAPSARRILTCQSTNTALFVGLMHRSAHHVTAISSVLIERAARFGRTGVVHIPNGIRLGDIRAACAAHPKVPGRVLFVGRLEPMKGVDILLASLAELRMENWELRIVGDGSQRTSLEALAGTLGIADRVSFAGYLPPAGAAREFAQGEIFCGLSRSEALGNVFLEAQAAGCAVIGTNTGGIPDIVKDGETGMLVPVDDVQAAAGALRLLLFDASVREKLAKAGMANAAAYDWQAIAERYAGIYDSM